MTGHRDLRSPLPVAVAGTGLHLPDRVVTNDELAAVLDTSDEWIVSRTGIRERRWLAADQAVSDLAVPAARSALDAAGRTAGDLDAILVASYTHDQPLPSTALVVKDALHADRALTLDVTNAACVNGIQAVFLAAHLLQSGAAGTVLVVAADCASRITDPQDRTTRVFFGDAAAALVLTGPSDPEAGLLSWDFGSELSFGVQIPAGGSRRPPSADTVAQGRHYVRMDGRDVWNTATMHLPDSILAAVSRAGLDLVQVHHLFLHQANLRIINTVADKLGVPDGRIPITLDTLGNTGSVGVFTALHQSFSRGAVHPGDLYLLSGIGAGFQWGTLCLRHS